MLPFDWLKKAFSPSPASLGFAVRAVSACGLVRKENQDSVLSMPARGFFAVADGMGGGACGALASAWVKEALVDNAAEFAAEGIGFEERAARLDLRLQEVNARIRDYCRENGFQSMGSTLALLLFDPLDRTQAMFMYVGDSRVYRLREGDLECLTQDHTVGGELSHHANSRREAAELASRRNPLTHILTRAIGTEFKVRPEWRALDVRRGDRYLICTDGVHDVLSDEELAAVLGHRGQPADWVAKLEEKVLAAGAGDNYSMICLALTKRG